MIKIQELRIGNNILVDNLLRKICCIKNDESSEQANCIGFEYNNECHYESCDTNRVTAVPLTDEIMLEMGFTFHTHFKRWQRKRPLGAYTIELDKDYWAVDYGNQPIVKDIQQVHRLQNLFFFIQGEELLLNSSNSIAVHV